MIHSRIDTDTADAIGTAAVADAAFGAGRPVQP